jgi:hypothetical protein
VFKSTPVFSNNGQFGYSSAMATTKPFISFFPFATIFFGVSKKRQKCRQEDYVKLLNNFSSNELILIESNTKT